MAQKDKQSAERTRLSWSRIARRIRVPLGFAFAAFYLWRARPALVSLIVGAVIAALGLGIRAIASGHVNKNQELAMTGPYAHVRNPLYLGSIVIAVGFAVAARDALIAVLIVVMFVVIYVPTIRSEEEYLQTHFAAYSSYARTVPRLVPRSWHFRGMAQDFSRELYWKHREYNASFGAAAILAALLVKMLWSRG